MKLTRREFLKKTSASIIGLGLVGINDNKSEIEKRKLGRTGLEVTILGLGCAQIGGMRNFKQAVKIIETAIDLGINYIDTASTYGNAEEKVGEVMKTRRNEVILATKTLQRDKDDSWREINTSIERLKTDYVDILQIHSVNTIYELNKITSKNGSLYAVIRAKEEGLCKHIGITGHTRPEVIKEALNRFDFETVLVPLSSVDKLLNDFGEVIFPIAKRKNIGVIAMKVLSDGRFTNFVSESLRYVFSLPISTAIVGMKTIDELKQNVEIAKNFVPMTKSEMERFIEKTKNSTSTSILWWKNL
ncbi:MAG: aldo/keto reductase [Candidatus Kryptonium sp.]|nr:aldo/keto reductase [Candidatus Kryptonium sp.]MDW8109515.1 aldo/keto reductase [Candidatus Kryptonium sp.]